MQPIWTDQQLEQWSRDAIGQINVDCRCIWQRECIPITRGVSVITLPDYVRTLQRVTWRGRTLTPQSWEELTLLTPASVFLHYPPDSAGNVETVISRPLFYAQHPTNALDIRLFPTPDESFNASGEPNVYSPSYNTPSCIIDYWRAPDPTGQNPIISIPSYILRRTQKAYVLWKAFAAEGKGQDFTASEFYQRRYQFLIGMFRDINDGCFVAKKYMLGDGMLDPHNYRYPKPMLAPNFERTIF